jgi:hypothetical protein
MNPPMPMQVDGQMSKRTMLMIVLLLMKCKAHEVMTFFGGVRHVLSEMLLIVPTRAIGGPGVVVAVPEHVGMPLRKHASLAWIINMMSSWHFG